MKPITAMALLTATLLSPVAGADQVTLRDVTAESSVLSSYSRTASAADEDYQALLSGSMFSQSDMVSSPMKGSGAPGVALIDYDLDNDLDIFVTNGPFAANSLFTNLLSQTGSMEFVDRAAEAGIDAPWMDASGSCYGDIDNDGDPDILVLSNFGPNALFVNLGDGTFEDRSFDSGLADEARNSVSCSFGDVDHDGFLDVVIANTFDMSERVAIFAEPFALNDHNQLFRNLGNGTFIDDSRFSGLESLAGIPAGAATITWAIALVDYDLDGDLDIVHADDQAAIPIQRDGGVNRGWIRVLANDGDGFFDDVTMENGMAGAVGHWMGLSFGDLNSDGRLDLFGTNVGDYAVLLTSPLDPVYGSFGHYELGDGTSRWYLGGADGTLTDPGVGSLVATPFGWGTSMVDLDNDADTDIVYYGGSDFVLFGVSSNPGVVLNNDGAGNMSYAASALAGSINHQRRAVQGVATGDLNGDGFVDVVSVSNFNVGEQTELRTFNHQWGSPFDSVVRWAPNLSAPAGQGVWAIEQPIDFKRGNLAVEMNAGNDNSWLAVKPMGTVGLLDNGLVNRQGLGAVISARTPQGRSMTYPVIGGSSYASQNAPEQIFGLGDEGSAAWVDVVWPGGVKNRLYNVRAGERLLFPEIPCSYDDEWLYPTEYIRCVFGAVRELQKEDVLDRRQSLRFAISALRAWRESQAQ